MYRPAFNVFQAILLAILLAACSARKAEPLPPGTVVLALGDSITAGYGLDPGQAWPALLAEKTGWKIVNGGISGDKTGDALARLPALLERAGFRLAGRRPAAARRSERVLDELVYVRTRET